MPYHKLCNKKTSFWNRCLWIFVNRFISDQNNLHGNYHISQLSHRSSHGYRVTGREKDNKLKQQKQIPFLGKNVLILTFQLRLFIKYLFRIIAALTAAIDIKLTRAWIFCFCYFLMDSRTWWPLLKITWLAGTITRQNYLRACVTAQLFIIPWVW